ncbi:hypothetical protein OROGR_008459 [Orobanche gracilis]
MGSKRKDVERDVDGCTVCVGVLVNGIECIVRENNEFTEYIPTRGVISNRPLMVIVAGGIPNEMKLKCEKALTFSFPSIGMKLLKPTSTTVGRMDVLEDFVKARANVNREYLDAFNEAYKASFGSSCMKYCTKELRARKELVMLGSYISRDLMEEKVKESDTIFITPYAIGCTKETKKEAKLFGSVEIEYGVVQDYQRQAKIRRRKFPKKLARKSLITT